eukprot:526747-Prorocentrum_minimum.AAC.3
MSCSRGDKQSAGLFGREQCLKSPSLREALQARSNSGRSANAPESSRVVHRRPEPKLRSFLCTSTTDRTRRRCPGDRSRTSAARPAQALSPPKEGRWTDSSHSTLSQDHSY